VLVVDDESHIRRVIEVKLKNYGYHVLYAHNGKDGLDIIRHEQPQIVITDINMPIVNGRELCEKSNPWKKTRSFLTMIVTARINPEDRNWVSGMQDTIFLEKPFSTSVLKKHIEQYLETDTQC
jgi:CheY-like chemotaxis protein